jgi:hypothetical protein
MNRWARLLLAVLFGVGQPLTFATVASRTLPSLPMRGWLAAAELTVAGLVAALGVAAAWSLITRAPHAVPLARVAVIAWAVRSVQTLYWTALPSDVVPGTESTLTALVVAHAAFWLWYLRRVARRELAA